MIDAIISIIFGLTILASYFLIFWLFLGKQQ